MRIHVLQHAPFEGLGQLHDSLASRDAAVSFTRFFDDATLPPASSVDAIIAMGGPMSVNDEDQLPWLRAEKQFVRDAAAHGIPMLGVCLGAQLIASALGAPVTRGEREIGWFPIEAVPSPDSPRPFDGERLVFHWHGETFALPPGATRLAQSAACSNQAFLLPGRIVGLQFHLEMTPQSIASLVEHCRDDLTPGRFVQPAAEMLATAPDRCAAMRADLARVLDVVMVPGARRVAASSA
jgi:GMP synthase-like glutamine amidotransferase